MANIPLWKRTPIKVGSGSVNYRINYNGQDIYFGKSINKPGETDTYIIINDIAEIAFRKMVFPAISGGSGFTSFNDGIFPTFQVVGQSINTNFNMVYDWSYENASDIGARDLIRPLRNDGITEVDYRQVVTLSIFSTSSKTIQAIYGGMSNLGSGKFGTGYIDLRGRAYHSDLSMRGFNTHHYKVVKSCYNYVLHYLNKIGGWDSILLNGICIPGQSYERKKIIEDDSESTYLNKVSQTWLLNRVLMFDDEGQRASEIVGTCHAVLEDLNKDGADRFIPVEIEDNSVEDLTMKSNGNRMVSLAIRVKASRIMERR